MGPEPGNVSLMLQGDALATPRRRRGSHCPLGHLSRDTRNLLLATVSNAAGHMGDEHLFETLLFHSLGCNPWVKCLLLCDSIFNILRECPAPMVAAVLPSPPAVLGAPVSPSLRDSICFTF